MKKIKVLIVDDHMLVRDGIKALLALASDIEVVGEAANGLDAIKKAKETCPDVILMDLAMPVMGGLEATHKIRRECPGSKILALTQYDDSDYVIPVIEAGAQGFVTKMSAFSELTTAIHAVYRGESYLSPTAAAALIEEIHTKSTSDSERDVYQQLTEREREILKLLVEGHTAKEIAEILILSPKTVEWYRTSLMEKLHIHNKLDLIKFAIRRKMISI